MYLNKKGLTLEEKEEKYNQIVGYVNKISNEILKEVAICILNDNKEEILKRTAGHDAILGQKDKTATHQCFDGGLIDHMLNVTKIAYNTGIMYKEEIDMDLIIFGAVFHDIGKIEIFDSYNKIPNIKGNLNDKYLLVDHLYIGMKIVDEYLTNANIEEKYKLQILHVIYNHMDTTTKHMVESYIVSFADSIDADIVDLLMYERNKINPIINEYIYKSCRS